MVPIGSDGLAQKKCAGGHNPHGLRPPAHLRYVSAVYLVKWLNCGVTWCYVVLRCYGRRRSPARMRYCSTILTALYHTGFGVSSWVCR